MSERLRGYVYLSLAMMTVGSTVVASKLIAAGFPPFAATALRFAIALPFFAMLMFATGTRLPRPDRHDWMILVLQAAAGSVGYTTLLITGLSFTSAANAGVVIGTLPIVSAAIAVLVLGERPAKSLLVAIGLAGAGVLAITVRGDAGAGSWLGNALIFAAVVCEGIFILLNKRLRIGLQPLAQSTLMAAIGLAVALPVALVETSAGISWTGSAFGAVVFYALVPTVAGFLLWYAGAARVSGSEASLFTAVAPVCALVFAAIFLGEVVTLNQIFGIACVIAAILSLVARRRSKSSPVQPS